MIESSCCDNIVTAPCSIFSLYTLIDVTASTGRTPISSEYLTPCRPHYRFTFLRYISSTHHWKILSVQRKSPDNTGLYFFSYLAGTTFRKFFVQDCVGQDFRWNSLLQIALEIQGQRQRYHWFCQTLPHCQTLQ